MPEGWQRLHPLSPLVRGGRGTIAVVVLLIPALLRGGISASDVFPLAVVGVLMVLGFVSWLVTRWTVEDDDLRIETGLLRRQSLRFPLVQVQAIDIVRPGLARVLGVAELRLRMGGATGRSARLSYLPEGRVDAVRAQLLELAHGAPTAAAPVPAEAAAGRVLTSVPTGQLVGSILLSDVGFYVEAVLAAIVIAALLEPDLARSVISGGGLFWLIGVITVTWRRFNQEYRLTVAEAPDGLRLAGGLVALTSETIRPGRIQAVRMVEPLLWRPLGWYRLQVDLAGQQKSEGEGQAQRRQLRTLLPVGSRAQVELLLDRIVPDRPRDQAPPPQRARWKSPVRYRMLGWGATDTCVVTTTGRVRRTTCWVPLEKMQSLRRVQGPVQRRLQLASVHVDTAGRAVRATLRDRDVHEADGALTRLADLARRARRPERPASPRG